MREMASEGFERAGRKAGEILRGSEKIESRQRPLLEKLCTGREVLQAMERNGLKFNVVEGGPANAAAWVVPGDPRPYVALETLFKGDITWALHVAHHEQGHIVTGVTDLDLRKNLPIERVSALERALDVPDLPLINLLEGFNERRTIKAIGKHENVAYLYKEVPIADELEKRCIALTGASLQEAYNEGNEELFFERIRALADRLLVEEKIQEMASQGTGNGVQSVEISAGDVEERLDHYFFFGRPELHEFSDVGKFAEKLFCEMVMMKVVHHDLAVERSKSLN